MAAFSLCVCFALLLTDRLPRRLQVSSTFQRDGSLIDNLPGQYKFLGLVLLLVFVFADSFTSNWQHKIFSDYSCAHSSLVCRKPTADAPSSAWEAYS